MPIRNEVSCMSFAKWMLKKGHSVTASFMCNKVKGDMNVAADARLLHSMELNVAMFVNHGIRRSSAVCVPISCISIAEFDEAAGVKRRCMSYSNAALIRSSACSTYCIIKINMYSSK